MRAFVVGATIRVVICRSVCLLALVSAIACGVNGAGSAATNSVAPSSDDPSRTPEVTKPPFSQPPLSAPTRVAWAIDRVAGQTDRPYAFELHYDGHAMGFRVVDASEQLVLQVPIAGSGIFGPETCLAAQHADGKTTNATWRGIDETTYRDFVAHSGSYRVEVETIGHGMITLPLGDTGCRR
jgi:hypothetical protein